MGLEGTLVLILSFQLVISFGVNFGGISILRLLVIYAFYFDKGTPFFLSFLSSSFPIFRTSRTNFFLSL